MSDLMLDVPVGDKGPQNVWLVSWGNPKPYMIIDGVALAPKKTGPWFETEPNKDVRKMTREEYYAWRSYKRKAAKIVRREEVNNTTHLFKNGAFGD